MRIAHEAPLCLMDLVQEYTDYDYALVHLFEEIPEYYEFFERAIAQGRHVILDNSIFELGEAFDSNKFANWIERLRPPEYIVPDALEDIHNTISNFEKWEKYFGDVPGDRIGVVQGKTYEEIVECYKFMDAHADKIAISFDYSLYEEETPSYLNKYEAWMEGRVNMLTRMYVSDIINTEKPHHLLGASLPQEFVSYKNTKWIDTIDTSNPVVHGIKDILYKVVLGREGYMYSLDNKESVKLFTLMDEDVLDKKTEVLYNILAFRRNAGMLKGKVL